MNSQKRQIVSDFFGHNNHTHDSVTRLLLHKSPYYTVYINYQFNSETCNYCDDEIADKFITICAVEKFTTANVCEDCWNKYPNK